MRRLRSIAVLVVLLVAGFSGQAATYYVSSTGSDENNGLSITGAWGSIDKVNATPLVPGDTVLFEGEVVFTGSLGFGEQVKGTPQNPIVFSSYGNGRAVIRSGTAKGFWLYNTSGFKLENLVFEGAGRTVSASAGIDIYMDLPDTKLAYIAIDHVEVYGYREAGILVGSWNGTSGFEDVYITNSSSHDNGDAGIMTYADDYKIGHRNVYVGHCKAYNNSGLPDKTWLHSGNGIVLGGVDGALIEYCEAYNNGWLNAWTSGGPVGIWGYLCNNLIIQYNESHHNKAGTSKDGGGFDIDGGSTNSVMQYNYSHDNEGAGYLLAQFDYAPTMKGITIRYNISENDGRKNGYGAIHLWASPTTTGLQDVQIYNNTVFLSPADHGTPKAVWIQSGGKVYATFRNNLFVTTGGLRLMDIQVTANTRFEGNNYWTSGAAAAFKWGTATHSSLAAWRTATKQEMRNGVALGYFLDPGLKQAGQGGTIAASDRLYTLQAYKLQKGSAMVGKALDLRNDFGLNTGESDFWGNSIKQRTDLCIGAHQLTDESKACLQGGLLPLTFGKASSGSYEGPGTGEEGYFDPVAAGAGRHALRYTYTDEAGNIQVQHQTVTVTDATSTSWTGLGGTSGWFEAENWSACIPDSGIDALIPAPGKEGDVLPIVKEGENAAVHDLSGNGALTVEQGGSLSISGTLLSLNLEAAPASSLIFQSDTTQYIPGGTYSNLLLEGTGAKKLKGHAVVTGQLDLKEGKLLLADQSLTLASEATITNYNARNYIVTDGGGRLTYQALGAGEERVFPVGTSQGYAPVKLFNKGTADSFSIGVEEKGHVMTLPEGQATSLNRTWHIDEAVKGGSDVTMVLEWSQKDEPAYFNRRDSFVSHYEDGDWQVMENSKGTVTQGTVSDRFNITLSGVSSFSPFTVASTTSMPPAPLPVTLATFTASRQGADVLLAWTTASELNNSGFGVEVSGDGKTFRQIGFVQSKSPDSQAKLSYTFRDTETGKAGTRYYRLRQVDLDGTATYSVVRAVAFPRAELNFSVYPNPFFDRIMLEIESPGREMLALSLTDAKGRQILQTSFLLQQGLTRLPIPLPQVQEPGFYYLAAYLGGASYHFKLVKR